MPRVDFPNIDEGGRTVVPDGEYVVTVDEVVPKTTKNGDEMWTLWLKIANGEHEGAIIFDNMTFSEKGNGRVKLICSRLGLDVTQAMNLEPRNLIGRHARVTVYTREYIANNGEPKKANAVPFDGYATTESSDFDPVPF